MWQIILIVLAVIAVILAVIILCAIAVLAMAARFEKIYPYLTGKEKGEEDNNEEKI